MPSAKKLPAIEINERLCRTVVQSHEHQSSEPTHRRLRIYTSDPVALRLESRTAVALVPYEPLSLQEADGNGQPPCLCSNLFEVCMTDADGRVLQLPRLDDAHQLLQDGYAPSEANPRFYAQMVYAVASKVHAAFRRALGREPGWSFSRPQGSSRLRIFPLGSTEENAWYDAVSGELRFGYFQVHDRGWVLTALSHDLIAHELTHALLDSQRPYFMEPTSNDVPGFHEGFADLIALFQHFDYPQALRQALATSRCVLFNRKPGEIASSWLCSIARQFGQSVSTDALRRADRSHDTHFYQPDLEEHGMGEVLLSAVFDAFDTVFQRRTARLRRLATAGSGLLAAGELPGDLLDALAEEASALAKEFTAVVVRAIDYCAPADIKLGEFLRAMVTADNELHPDDPWAVREALIDAFRRRKILPSNVFSLSEDSLIWAPPRTELPVLRELSFAETRFGSAPGRPTPANERLRQARALGDWLANLKALDECGLVLPGDARLKALQVSVSIPVIDALETTRRIGADGEVHFETVAVVTQTATVLPEGKKKGFSFICGCTLLFSPRGELRLAISKSVLGHERIKRRRDFITGGSTVANRYWEDINGTMQLKAQWSRWMHVAARA